MVISNSTRLESLLEKYMEKDEEWWISKQRGKRAITESDMQVILDLHNKLRGQVYPSASNMEYMAVENHPYLYRTEPSWVGCASGEPPVPVLYRALTGRMCQWRTTRTRTVPSPHGSDVPVEKEYYSPAESLLSQTSGRTDTKVPLITKPS
ncbi:UNVERIFIED_CONTAM: hypothetical protein FKN15_005519 [Acipenser sinensis]